MFRIALCSKCQFRVHLKSFESFLRYLLSHAKIVYLVFRCSEFILCSWVLLLVTPV
jgi:hypothetical protein